ncbi:protein translocase subunit SecD [Rhodobacterales bacterium HKCCE3408]|nr:protein translocase subunit SecD [Rhodobacterales bacterium HKCCE3408]
MLNISLFNRIVIVAVVLAGLLFAMPNLFYDRVERHNDAVLQIEATGAETDEQTAARAAWPSYLPSGIVNLGLDLRGGAHLLAEVQLDQVYERRMEGLWPDIRDRLRDERDTIGTIQRLPPDETPTGELHVRISRPENIADAVAAVRELAQPVASLTGVGSSTLDVRGEGDTVIVTLSDAERLATDNRTMQQSLEIIRRRVDEAGTREPTIQRQGEDRILIQVPGVGSAQELKDIIGRTARLTFHPVIGAASPGDSAGVNELVLPEMDAPDSALRLERAEVMSGEDLTDAQPAFNQNGQPVVSFRLNTTAAQTFCRYTQDNVGAPFAIVLDEEIVSAPRINEPICGGAGQISGNFTVESSTDLAILLRAGALPAEMVFLEERTIGPELGSDSIAAGQLAAVVACVAVLIFMWLSYGLFGLFANLALMVNVAMIFGLLSLLGATLTLPGIAGIVLTIGMAVDANVLVFERIREELKTAKGPARAIELGYERALSAIIDANITTFIVAVILWVMGSGPVRGFATTLGLGIVTSVFTAIFVTRLFIVWWFERRRPRKIEV